VEPEAVGLDAVEREVSLDRDLPSERRLGGSPVVPLSSINADMATA
jgi:hypothetical protein